MHRRPYGRADKILRFAQDDNKSTSLNFINIINLINMYLTEHFNLYEFERSSKAQELGIINQVPSKYLPSLHQLCEVVLEPLRSYVGGPIYISSGYRHPIVNHAVGGAKHSQHLYGEAADIRIPDVKTGKDWMRWIINETDFDECIMETCDRVHYWLHVSCNSDRTQNRHRVISFLLKKAAAVR